LIPPLSIRARRLADSAGPAAFVGLWSLGRVFRALDRLKACLPKSHPRESKKLACGRLAVMKMGAASLMVFSIGILAGQGLEPAFDVASVKRSARTESKGVGVRYSARGGPGTSRPTHFECRGCPLALLIAKAYDLELYQVSGPNWIEDDLFEIAATLPENTSIEQFHRMLQSLLVERFRLKIRRETRDSPGYELSIGPGGSKLQEAGSPVDQPEMTSPPQMKTDQEGFPILPPGMTIAMSNGRFRRHTQENIGGLARFLSLQLGKPVVDRTGLTSRYDITLSFVAPRLSQGQTDGPEIPGPTLSDAVSRTGLRLRSTKVQVDYVVVQSAERIPIEN
jgi:uncharacterized protein (TIGR03435 family)